VCVQNVPRGTRESIRALKLSLVERFREALTRAIGEAAQQRCRALRQAYIAKSASIPSADKGGNVTGAWGIPDGIMTSDKM
jgi:hypothetical protein